MPYKNTLKLFSLIFLLGWGGASAVELPGSRHFPVEGGSDTEAPHVDSR